MNKGDLLLVKFKFDILGYIIRKVIKCEYNHVAWLINKNYLLEVARQGIIIREVSKYNNKFLYTTKILKLKNITPLKLTKAINYAIDKEGRKNPFKLWLTYIMILLKYQEKPFRYSCSGLIAECLSKIGFYFDKRKKPQNITPIDIIKSKRTYETNINSD